ncbi:MAG: hypothetical protein Q9209_003751 [Squamulea sp. 1 TL-2023]
MTHKSPVRPDPNPFPNGTLYAASVRSASAHASYHKAHVGTSAPPPTARLQPPDGEPVRTSQGLCVPFSISSTLMAKFFKLRGNRSPPHGDQKLSGPRQGQFKCIWRRATDNEQKLPCETPSLPIESQLEVQLKTPHWDLAESFSTVAQAVNVAPCIADAAVGLNSASHRSHSIARRSTIECKSRPASDLELEEDSHESTLMQRSSPGSRRSTANSCLALVDINLAEHNSCGASATASSIASSADMSGPVWREPYEASSLRLEDPIEMDTGSNWVGSPLVLPIQSNMAPQHAIIGEKTAAGPFNGSKRPARPPSLLHDNRATLETFYTKSLLLDGQSSPQYLLQPESPSTRDFGEASESDTRSHVAGSSVDHDSPPTVAWTESSPAFDLLPLPQVPSPGLQGYRLPEAEQAPISTLCELPGTVFSPVQEHSPKSDNNRFLQSWNDGSDPRRLTALDELVEDLGYLCHVIS